MIYLVTGTTGAKKTAFVVSILEKLEIDNKINIVKNAKFYKDNLEILTKKDLLNELSYFLNEVGTGETFRNEVEILDSDFFDMLGVDDYEHLRPDDYFKRSVMFNKIIERIQETQGEIGLQFLLPVRTIYTNINALKIDYVRSLIEDWRKCPDGSLIVIDEIQLVYPYSDIKDKSHPIVAELSVHRHRGFDFYFITQSAGNLHVLIKDLVYTHYHVTVPFGFKTKIYQYGEFKANPNAKSVKLLAENTFSFSPSPHIFKLYKSTTINTAKSRLPIRYILMLCSVVLFGLFIAIYAVFFSNGGLKSPTEKLEETSQAPTQETPKDNVIDSVNSVVNNNTPTTPTEPMPATITKEQMEKQLKLQEEHFNYLLEQQRLQLIMQYDTLQKQLIEHDEQIKSFYRTLELYKTMLPKDYKELKANPDLQVRGVVKMGNQCRAYNAQGVLMTLNHEQCSYYTEATGRVWKNGQTTDNSPGQPRLPPTLTDNSTRTLIPAPQQQAQGQDSASVPQSTPAPTEPATVLTK